MGSPPAAKRSLRTLKSPNPYRRYHPTTHQSNEDVSIIDKFFDVLSGIVLVALATTLVAHKETRAIIGESSKGFAGALTAAEGG